MTDHEQPAAGLALKPLYGHLNYLKDPDGLAMIRQVLLEVRDWHDPAPINCNSLARLLDTIEALRAPTDAGGAVSEAATIEKRFPELNDHLIRMASTGNTGSLGEWGDFFNCLRAALTPAPQAEGEKLRPIPSHPDAPLGRPKAPQPLQQGGEVTREMIEAILAKHLANNPSQIAFGNATDAILSLFASLAADRDKAVGLLKRLLDADADATKNPTGGLSLGGLMDCRDNSGCVYQSADLADILAKLAAFLSSQTEGR